MAITDKKIPLCVLPFTQPFVKSDGTYRDCCATAPKKTSKPTESFNDWWHGDTLNKFRTVLQESDELPPECAPCKIQEQIHGQSYRLIVNKEIDQLSAYHKHPGSWHIMFGNKCNLACWMCSEDFSSLIAQHKKQIKILPDNFVDPNDEFLKKWPDLKENILTSYNHHDVVKINILGGEPTYNKIVTDFLQYLADCGLAKRTRIEITTNGTKLGKNLSKLFNSASWNYIAVFISVDAIGPRGEWLRYGSVWDEVRSNIDFYKDNVNYTELHTSLNILNLDTLPALSDFCKDNGLSHKIYTLSTPWFMDIRAWNKDTNFINQDDFTSRNLDGYIDLLGSAPVDNAYNELRDYINRFNSIRKPLSEFDKSLATLLDL